MFMMSFQPSGLPVANPLPLEMLYGLLESGIDPFTSSGAKKSPNKLLANQKLVERANQEYKERQYRQAIESYLESLDKEPGNFIARLMLGASYYRTGQFAAALRAFRLVCDRCGDEEITDKAFSGLQATIANLERKSMTMDFSNGKDTLRQPLPVPPPSWL